MNRNTSILLLLAAAFAAGCDRDGDGVSDDGDCAPENADIHPGAEEVCDGIDNNCDGRVDEDVTLTFYGDSDGDGFGNPDLRVQLCEATEEFLADNSDCDDTNPDNYPGAAEVCDGVDNNCDNLIDGDDPTVDLSTAGDWYRDADHDGYGAGDAVASCDQPAGYVDNAEDCDDNSSAIHPELVWYGDLDGDEYGDDTYTLTQCEQPEGFVNVGGDCDEYNVEVNPAATEYCDDIDNNCDGAVDEDSSEDAPTWYQDDDGDAYGTSSTTIACYQPSGYAAVDGDCDDTEPLTNPGELEHCDGIDNDCDSVTDFDYSVPADFPTIQAAIDNVDPGTSFCVSAGTYYENLYVWQDVGIIGEGSATILDGNDDRLFYAEADFELRDVSVENSRYSTGGVGYIDNGSALIDNVEFSNVGCDSSYYCEGNLFYVEDGALTFSNSSIDGMYNESTGYMYGGLIYADEAAVTLDTIDVTNSSFLTRYSNYGGLFYVYESTLDLVDSTFENNTVGSSSSSIYGGLVYNGYYSEATTEGVRFDGNTVTASNSDINGLWYQTSSEGQADLRNTSFSDNTVEAYDDLWGVFYVSSYQGAFALTNGLVAGNTFVSTGGNGSSYGLLYAYYSDIAFTNSDLSENAFNGFNDYLYGLFYRSYQAEISLHNTNVVNNTATNSYTYAGILYASYSNDDGYGEFEMNYSNLYGNWTSFAYGYDWYDGGDDGDLTQWTGNLSDDPLYTDAANGDYTLATGSPAIDAGDPELLDTDETTSDIGAYGGPNAAL